MSEKRVIVVFGATGNQGGSVIDSILNDKKASSQFKIRAITRDPSKPNAVALKERGVECVSANLDDKASLFKALQGAYAVWAVTDYWAYLDAEREIQQGKNLVDAAQEAGIKHIVFSTLMNITKLSGGTLTKVDHFDSKAKIEEYIREVGAPATFFMPGFYMSNIPGGMMRPDSEGNWTFALPIPKDSPMPLFDAAHDTGKWVKAILLKPEQTMGKRVLGSGDYYTPEQMIEQFKEAYPEAGKTAKYVELTPEQFKTGLKMAGTPEAAHEELLQNMILMPRYGYYGGADLQWSNDILDEKATTWKEFIGQAKALTDVK